MSEPRSAAKRPSYDPTWPTQDEAPWLFNDEGKLIGMRDVT